MSVAPLRFTEQAISILRQFVQSGGDDLFYNDWGGGQFTLQVGNICSLEVTEPRFIKEDLAKLVLRGLLQVETASREGFIYHMTRMSVPFLNNVDRDPAAHTSEASSNTLLNYQIKSGTVVGQWTLKDKAGEGGNGLVWSAFNSKGEKAAIKFLKPEFIGTQREKRFRDEIDFLRKERGSVGILPLIDFSYDALIWFSTSFAHCFTNLSLDGQHNLEKLCGYLSTVAKTLARLHGEHKWHRDLKPENLFLLNELPVIGDFGLVHFPDKETNTKSSENVGSRNFTAPELEGHGASDSGGEADVYSLAKTLWVLACGKRIPPSGHLRVDTVSLRLGTSCAHPRIHTLERLIERATDPSPNQRPTMEAFAKELSEWLNPVWIQTTPSIIALTAEQMNVFEEERDKRLAKQKLEREAESAMSSFEPILENIALTIRSQTHADAHPGYPMFSEDHEFRLLYGGLRSVFRQAREVRASVGEDWVNHLQTFVQVEAIEDKSIRVVCGHFVELTVHGERPYGAATEMWKKEIRCPSNSAELQNEIALCRAGLLEHIGVALQSFADVVMKAKQKKNPDANRA